MEPNERVVYRAGTVEVILGKDILICMLAMASFINEVTAVLAYL